MALSNSQVLWFRDQLRSTFSEVLAQETPPLDAFTLFETDSSIPPGAMEYVQELITTIGRAKVASGFNPKDAPRIDIGKSRDVFQIRPIVASYGWTIFEIMQGSMAGEMPDRLRGVGTRDVVLKEHNEVFWAGAEDHGVWGILNHPGVPRRAVANRIDFVGAPSADNAIADIFDLLFSVRDATSGIYAPTNLVVPTATLSFLATTPRSTTSDTTVLEFIIKTYSAFGQLTVTSSVQLDTDRLMVAYVKGRQHQKLVIPGGMSFEQEDPQAREYEFVVPCWGLNGGFSTSRPLTMVIGEMP